MPAEERRKRSTEAFFGRRHGKSLRPRPLAALQKQLPRYRLDLAAPAPTDLSTLFRRKVGDVRLEIGFGGGEHLLHGAIRAPECGFIGVEPFVNGMARLMLDLERQPLDNVMVYDNDAARLLDWLPATSLASIDLLYPDPWPKKRHWKRRFVNAVNLDRFARLLRRGGEFRFASDIDSYVNWTLLCCRTHPAFEWQARTAADWRDPYEDWPGTRYEAKAIREARNPAYLSFLRV